MDSVQFGAYLQRVTVGPPLDNTVFPRWLRGGR
jgi:hypothetical protein